MLIFLVSIFVDLFFSCAGRPFSPSKIKTSPVPIWMEIGSAESDLSTGSQFGVLESEWEGLAPLPF